MPAHHFILGLADGIRAKAHKFSLIQQIKMRLPYLIVRVVL